MGTYLTFLARCRVRGAVKRFTADLQGATAVEYGLLAGLVAIGLGIGIGSMSDLVQLIFNMLGERTTEVAEGMQD